MIGKLKIAVTNFFDQIKWAILIYRISSFAYKRKYPFIPAFLHLFGRWFTGIEMQPSAVIGSDFRLIHGLGTVIGSFVRIDDGVTVLHQVTIGAKEIKGKYSQSDVPHICKNVVIGAGAKILGGLVVGEGANVGANSVVIKDVPAFTMVAGIPARPIKTFDHQSGNWLPV